MSSTIGSPTRCTKVIFASSNHRLAGSLQAFERFQKVLDLTLQAEERKVFKNVAELKLLPVPGFQDEPNGSGDPVKIIRRQTAPVDEFVVTLVLVLSRSESAQIVFHHPTVGLRQFRERSQVIS